MLARLFVRAAGALVADPLPHAQTVACQGNLMDLTRLVAA